MQKYVEIYRENDTIAPVIISFASNQTLHDLRAIIKEKHENYAIKSVLLVGDLPAGFYEMNDWGSYEDFPSDLYLMDYNSMWTDNNNNGIFDSHGNIELKVPVGRITGTVEELSNYFDKLKEYHQNPAFVPSGAYIFVDDDWISYYSSSEFNIQLFCSTIIRDYEPLKTTKENYINRMNSQGFQYVYQFIHSYPDKLAIMKQGGYEYLTTGEISGNDLKASFYNLFCCTACRFTEENIGTAYVVKSTKGLAAIGTTKIGGNYWPDSFNMALSQNKTWGESFITWYNTSGKMMEDKWVLGMVIIGDPMLNIKKENLVSALPPLTEPPKDMVDKLEILMKKNAQHQNCQSFEQFKNKFPNYYKYTN